MCISKSVLMLFRIYQTAICASLYILIQPQIRGDFYYKILFHWLCMRSMLKLTILGSLIDNFVNMTGLLYPFNITFTRKQFFCQPSLKQTPDFLQIHL